MRTRLQKLMASEGLTSAKLAEIAGVQPSTVSHILSGRNNPSFEFITNLLKAYPSLNSRWLLLGDGSIYTKDQRPNTAPLLESSIQDEVIEQPAISKNTSSINNPDSSQPIDPLRKHIDHKCELHSEDGVKSTEKIVIFYSDGTFSMYQNK